MRFSLINIYVTQVQGAFISEQIQESINKQTVKHNSRGVFYKLVYLKLNFVTSLTRFTLTSKVTGNQRGEKQQPCEEKVKYLQREYDKVEENLFCAGARNTHLWNFLREQTKMDPSLSPLCLLNSPLTLHLSPPPSQPTCLYFHLPQRAQSQDSWSHSIDTAYCSFQADEIKWKARFLATAVSTET